MFKKIAFSVLALLAVAIVIFLGIVALQPDESRVARSAKIDAPPATVFAFINDLHHWNDWSPWAKLDPNAKYSLSGADSGNGAKFTWSGNDQVGEGALTIVDSKPEESIRMQLDFIKPMQATNFVQFDLAPAETGTTVTWSMVGKPTFVQKAVCLFMDMDKMIGDQFEQGLANLQTQIKQSGGNSGSEAADATPPADAK